MQKSYLSGEQGLDQVRPVGFGIEAWALKSYLSPRWLKAQVRLCPWFIGLKTCPSPDLKHPHPKGMMGQLNLLIDLG